MLITPRTYVLSQTPDRGFNPLPYYRPRFLSLSGWHPGTAKTLNMLLVHQTGSVHVGEVVRFVYPSNPQVFGVHQ